MNVPLFSTPVSIHGMQVANRFVMAPMSVRYAAPNGEVTEKLISYYEARAAGGAGLIIVEATCVELAGKNGPNGLAVYDDSHIAGLSKLVRRVKNTVRKSPFSSCIAAAAPPLSLRVSP